jgi:hypothetical protein
MKNKLDGPARAAAQASRAVESPLFVSMAFLIQLCHFPKKIETL